MRERWPSSDGSFAPGGAAGGDARRVREAVRPVDAPRAGDGECVARVGRRRPTAPSSATSGCTSLHKIPNPVAEPETHAYLSNLYVKPSERGGIGHAAARHGDQVGAVERRRSRRAVALRAKRDALSPPRLLARRRGHGAERIQARDDPLKLGVDRGLRRRILSRQLERMIALRRRRAASAPAAAR